MHLDTQPRWYLHVVSTAHKITSKNTKYPTANERCSEWSTLNTQNDERDYICGTGGKGFNLMPIYLGTLVSYPV